MKIKRFRQRLLSLLCLVLILVPMLVLGAYASSPEAFGYRYSFTFNLEAKTMSTMGVKEQDDLSKPAHISITGASFGTGSVRYWFTDIGGDRVSDITAYYRTYPEDFFLPYNVTFHAPTALIMKCEATYGVTGVGGYFEP